MDQSEFRRRMRIAREHAGLDQAELAVKLHADGWIKSAGREQISHAENGQRELTPKVLEAIEQICAVPRGFLSDETVQAFQITRSVLVLPKTVIVTENGGKEEMTVTEALERGYITEETAAEADRLATERGEDVAPAGQSLPRLRAKSESQEGTA